MNVKFYRAFSVVSFFVLCVLLLAYYKDSKREWKTYQGQYYGIASQYAKTADEKERIKKTPLKIEQVVLKDFGRVDRCMTCHLGVEDPDLKNEALPYRYHPDAPRHPFDKFGCTICHQGQGLATTKEAAHGHVKHWEAPLLPKEFLQASCGKCHLEGEVPDAPDLSLGRTLFDEKGCRGCHKFHGIGGVAGPDISTIGRPGHRNPEWLFEHFKDPQKAAPGTIMPKYGFTDKEAKALTLYMLSLTDEKITGYYASKKVIPDKSFGRKLFFEKGCLGCHSLAGSGGKVGPDLTKTGLRRSPGWVFRHFKNPQVVSPGTLMPKFGFSDEESKSLTLFVLGMTTEDILKASSQMKVVSTEALKVKTGASVYKKYGCGGCHGEKGEGGLKNPNSKAGEVPPLQYVKMYYPEEALTQIIREGRVPEKKDPKGQEPPLYMPPWKDVASEEEVDALVSYLYSLMPKE